MNGDGTSKGTKDKEKEKRRKGMPRKRRYLGPTTARIEDVEEHALAAMIWAPIVAQEDAEERVYLSDCLIQSLCHMLIENNKTYSLLCIDATPAHYMNDDVGVDQYSIHATVCMIVR
jgi:hypothetical protein